MSRKSPGLTVGSVQVVLLDFESGANREADENLRQELEQINGNSRLSEQYLQLARDLDVMEAKTPEDVYKSHLVEGRAGDGPSIDSARQNLASTFVNAFVNAGFGQDKLVTATPESGSEVSGFSLKLACIVHIHRMTLKALAFSCRREKCLPLFHAFVFLAGMLQNDLHALCTLSITVTFTISNSYQVYPFSWKLSLKGIE